MSYEHPGPNATLEVRDIGHRMALLALALVVACLRAAADDGVVAYDLMGELDRLAFDSRSAGMGGASLALRGLPSAPVNNPATVGLGDRDDLSISYGGESPAGGLASGEYFRAGTPDRVTQATTFNEMYRWARGEGGRNGYADMTLLGAFGSGDLVIFGTKAAISRPTLRAQETAAGQELRVVGPGIEYEDMGFAFGHDVSDRLRLGLKVHEVRFYRAQMDYTVVRDGSGAIGLISDDSEIVRGLEWTADFGAFWDAPGPWDYGVAIRHIDAPTFRTITGEASWRLHPSLDLGASWTSTSGRDIVAVDVRNVFGVNGGKPILRIGWEHALDSRGRWLTRLGLRDGRPSFGLGYRGHNGFLELATGTSPRRQASFSAGWRF